MPSRVLHNPIKTFEDLDKRAGLNWSNPNARFVGIKVKEGDRKGEIDLRLSTKGSSGWDRLTGNRARYGRRAIKQILKACQPGIEERAPEHNKKSIAARFAEVFNSISKQKPRHAIRAREVRGYALRIAIAAQRSADAMGGSSNDRLLLAPDGQLDANQIIEECSNSEASEDSDFDAQSQALLQSQPQKRFVAGEGDPDNAIAEADEFLKNMEQEQTGCLMGATGHSHAYLDEIDIPDLLSDVETSSSSADWTEFAQNAEVMPRHDLARPAQTGPMMERRLEASSEDEELSAPLGDSVNAGVSAQKSHATLYVNPHKPALVTPTGRATQAPRATLRMLATKSTEQAIAPTSLKRMKDRMQTIFSPIHQFGTVKRKLDVEAMKHIFAQLEDRDIDSARDLNRVEN